MANRQQAHALIDQLAPDQLSAIIKLLEVMMHASPARENAEVPLEEEAIGDDEERAVAEAKDWLLQNGGKGIPHEEVLADFGLTMEEFVKMGERRAASRC